ncbi:MAG: NAD(P)H-hydrate dehydratase [Patescibacteria group bacterium]
MERLIQDKIIFPEIIWQRPQNIHKRQAGKILIIAGSKGMSGAGLLTAEAAFRTGIGLIVFGYPESLKDVYRKVLPEMMSLILPETPAGSLSLKALEEIVKGSEDVDMVVLGPGLTRNSETVSLIQQVVAKIDKPLIIDADGLNAISEGNPDEIFSNRPNRTIITPHYGEMGRLIKLSPKEIEDNKYKLSERYAREWNLTLVLKGQETLITEPAGKQVINKSGGPGLATAGSGDVLSGIIATLGAQNQEKLFEAAATSVYLHGLAGDLATKEIGERSVMATDVINYLPEALKYTESQVG